MCKSIKCTRDDLGDLRRSERLFYLCRYTNLERNNNVVEVLIWSVKALSGVNVTCHPSVNEGIDAGEQPDGRRHVSDPGPHCEHSASVVIALKEGGLLAFRQDDESIHNLIEFRKIEEPSIIR